jgi:hypothetical protein
MPTPAHGDIRTFLMALYGQDTNRFITMVQTDIMANMQALLAPANGLMLVGHALGV